MADVDYVKSTKKLVNESLMRWRMEKYKEQKARQTGADGVVHGEVKIPSIGLVTFMNIIIRSWFSNDLSDMKQRWPQLRMVSNSLAKELG